MKEVRRVENGVISLMWGMKSNTTNEHDRQRLMDVGSSMVVTKGEGRGVDQGKRGRIRGDGRKFNSGQRTHTTHSTYNVVLNRTLTTYNFINQGHPDKCNKKIN